jgi:hypothetical protein
MWFANVLCADRVFSEVPSPDGRVIATLFERDCGATTNFVTSVSLRASSKPFNRKRQGSVAQAKGPQCISVRWRDNRHLAVTISKDAQVYKQDNDWRDVKIDYEDAASPQS